MSDLLFAVDDHVATITLNRPQQRNAISYEIWCELIELSRQIEADDQIWAVLVRGMGEEAFSAGGDVAEFSTRRSDGWQAKIYNGKVEMALQGILHMSKPTIAVIKGYCLGGGCELAIHCDLRIAAENARFGMPVAQLGAVIGYDEMQRFVHLIGAGATLDLLLTGRMVGADEARALGLCSQVYPLAEIDQQVAALVQAMMQMAPLSHRWHKQMLQTVLRKPDLSDLTTDEALLPDECFNTQDYKEGIQAFVEKRQPQFRGV